jgi:hypothetical protein
MDPKILIKIVSVWNCILSIESVKALVLSQNNVCLPIISHLLQSCLIQSNKNLQENIDEMIEDLKMDAVVDPHIKEILTKISSPVVPSIPPPSSSSATKDVRSPATPNNTASNSKKEGDVFGAEEFNYVGSALVGDVADLFADLVHSMAGKAWLQSTVNNLLVQNINSLSANFLSTNNNNNNNSLPPSSPLISRSSGGSSPNKSKQQQQMRFFSLDLCFLFRLLPMVSDNKAELVLQMVNFLLQIIEHNKIRYNSFSKRLSKEMIVLPLNCCQIVGQILQTCLLHVNFSSGAANNPAIMEWVKLLDPLINLLGRGMVEYITAKSSAHSQNQPPHPMDPSHELLFQGITILLTQTINLYSDLLLYETSLVGGGAHLVLTNQLEEMFQSLLNHPENCSLEIFALTVCCQDILNPTSIAPVLLSQLLEATSLLRNAFQTQNWSAMGPFLEIVSRLSGSLDVLTRNHSISKANRRQNLVQHFSSLPVNNLHFLLLFLFPLSSLRVIITNSPLSPIFTPFYYKSP